VTVLTRLASNPLLPGMDKRMDFISPQFIVTEPSAAFDFKKSGRRENSKCAQGVVLNMQDSTSAMPMYYKLRKYPELAVGS